MGACQIEEEGHAARVAQIAERFYRLALDLDNRILSSDHAKGVEGLGLGSCPESFDSLESRRRVLLRARERDERRCRFRHREITQGLCGFLPNASGSVGAGGAIERP